MKKITMGLALVFWCGVILAQDVQEQPCAENQKTYNDGGFNNGDFSYVHSLELANTIHPDPGSAVNTEELVFPIDQPFYADYLSEGAGASHSFGFFFLDVDTNKDGKPDFSQCNPQDDLDGDGLVNEDDDDDDNDGILDTADNAAAAGVTHSTASYVFRFGEQAAAAGFHPGDYWQFVPSNKITHSSGILIFEHPGAYLYQDEDADDIPDILQYNVGANKIPPYCVDKGYTGYHRDLGNFPGFLGKWHYSGTPGGTAGDQLHWLGSTIFALADDDGGAAPYGDFSTYSPYYPGVTDIYGSADANVDYDIYGTTDPGSGLIPDEAIGVDDRGVNLWQYRWFQGTVAGGREFCFFLTVFYGSGGSHVNTYYSKSGFNLDNPPGTPGRNVATTGDDYGGSGLANWFPVYRNQADHDYLVQQVFGVPNWTDIATWESNPVALDPDNQEWVDQWENITPDRKVIQYRGLSDWFHESTVNANEVINGRYDIDMALEGDSSIIRAINGNMAHLMVGAPREDEEAWLLGWEDLFGGGDTDYEDVVFYVKRETAGALESQNVASDLDRFADVSLSLVEFTFVDNFLPEFWGTEGTYINYFYRLSTVDDWIPLLGGEHLADPDLFTTTVENGLVTRTVSIPLSDVGKRQVYWKAELKTADVDTIVPEIHEADVRYEALVHGLFFNSAVIPSSNVVYYGAHETPSIDWSEKNKNRGHVYCLKTFDHGDPGTATEFPEDYVPLERTTEQPPYPWIWDAGVTMNTQGNRVIYTFLKDNPTAEFSDNLSRYDFSTTTLALPVQQALNLSDAIVNGIMRDNFHNPASPVLELDQASVWLANWVHGYKGAITDGEITIPGEDREWRLGGINRASVAVVRKAGTPQWLSGSAIPITDKRSYSEFIKQTENNDLPTRVLVGSEAGMLHMLDAGNWIGKKCNPLDEWADGCYLGDAFGTGAEVWAVIPANLLDDIKYNYTGANSVSAKIDTTPVVSVVKYGSQWKRIVVVAQGENGGTENGHVGNRIWAMDITDVDNPIPLWTFTHSSMDSIIHPITLAWADFNGVPTWIVAFPSGSIPHPDNRARMIIREAYTGAPLLSSAVGSLGESLTGAPALVDRNQDGYVDLAIAATSEGKIIAQFLDDTARVLTKTVPNARFFLTPNVAATGDEKVVIVAVSGDNPLVDDDEIPDQPNQVYTFALNTEPAAAVVWETYSTLELPLGHKAFSRPKLVGNALVMGTTTGETFSLCDPDPNDPGNLYLINDVFDLVNTDFDPDTGNSEVVEQFGSIKAPIMVIDGVIHAHRSGTGGTLGYSPDSEAKNLVRASKLEELAIGNIFGVIGWREAFFDEF